MVWFVSLYIVGCLKKVSLHFDFFKKIDDTMIVSVNLPILQQLILNGLVGITSVLVYILSLIFRSRQQTTR